MIVYTKEDVLEKFPIRVYDITYDQKGYPHFLIFEKGQWLRRSAKHYRPAFLNYLAEEHDID